MRTFTLAVNEYFVEFISHAHGRRHDGPAEITVDDTAQTVAVRRSVTVNREGRRSNVRRTTTWSVNDR